MTKIYDLVTKFFQLVASWLLKKKVNFEPWNFNTYKKSNIYQGLTLTLTRSPLESKIGSVESEKCQLIKSTCPIRKVIFYSLESSFWCSNRLLEN